MGYLLYGDSGRHIVIDDVTLIHLQVVFAAVLTRNSSFFFSYAISLNEGSGREVLWVYRRVAMVFHLDSGQLPMIDRERIALLIEQATRGGHIELGADQLTGDQLTGDQLTGDQLRGDRLKVDRPGESAPGRHHSSTGRRFPA